MEESQYSELKSSLSAISVKALNYSSRLKLAYNLDSRQVLLSEKGFSRDYRGLAELIGFQYHAIKKFGEFEDRTMKILESWETRPDATLDKLISYLEDMDRHDIIQELIPSLKKNVDAYLEYQKSLEIPIKVAEEFTTYDAYASYTGEDASIGNQSANILESPEIGLKLFIRGRDMLTEMLALETNIAVIKNRLIEESIEKKGKFQASTQISFRHPVRREDICKTIKVDNRLSAQETGIKDCKLWVKTGEYDAPYPLTGHEFPSSTKMNLIRELLRDSEFDFRNVNSISTDGDFYFILRKNTPNSSIRVDVRLQGKEKKRSRPHNKIHWLFRKPAAKDDSVDSSCSSPPQNSLFSMPQWKLCPDNSNLPKPIMSMLVQLFLQGPQTVGIFRRSANVRVCREIKEKLESDPECDMKKVPIIVLSSVFKEFLRSLPDCLLHSDLYKQWLQAISCESELECKKRVLSLLKQLPPANFWLLQYLLCLLWHIAQHAPKNKMSSMNLAVCISPTLLNPGKFHSSVLQQEDVVKRMPKVVSFLIDHCAELFGEQVLQLLGTFPERDGSCRDSSAEESDSLHSLRDLAGPKRKDFSTCYFVSCEIPAILDYGNKIDFTKQNNWGIDKLITSLMLQDNKMHMSAACTEMYQSAICSDMHRSAVCFE